MQLLNDIVKYTPNQNYIGTDSFKYQCVSQFAESNISTVKIIIRKNIPDIIVKNKKLELNYLVINLDYLQDYYGTEFKISIICKPSLGKLLITNHKLIYKPNNKITLKDKFNLKISNKYMESNVFEIKIKNLTTK